MVKHKKKKHFPFKFSLLIISFIIFTFLVFLRIFYFWERDHKSYSTITTIFNTDLKLYTNKIAKFSIQVPHYVGIRERYELAPQIGNDYSGGSVCFYDPRFVNYEDGCEKGLVLSYGLPEIYGKGGGCDPEFISYLMVQGKKHWMCISDKGIGGPIYWKHPAAKIDVTIDAIFTGRLTKQETLTILQTFHFIK